MFTVGFLSDVLQNNSSFFSQIEDYEEETVLRPGCKEYFWLLCKLIDNIHVKDASQVGFVLHSYDSLLFLNLGIQTTFTSI